MVCSSSFPSFLQLFSDNLYQSLSVTSFLREKLNTYMKQQMLTE